MVKPQARTASSFARAGGYTDSWATGRRAGFLEQTGGAGGPGRRLTRSGPRGLGGRRSSPTVPGSRRERPRSALRPRGPRPPAPRCGPGCCKCRSPTITAANGHGTMIPKPLRAHQPSASAKAQLYVPRPPPTRAECEGSARRGGSARWQSSRNQRPESSDAPAVTKKTVRLVIRLTSRFPWGTGVDVPAAVDLAESRDRPGAVSFIAAWGASARRSIVTVACGLRAQDQGVRGPGRRRPGISHDSQRVVRVDLGQDLLHTAGRSAARKASSSSIPRHVFRSFFCIAWSSSLPSGHGPPASGAAPSRP
jgi:hypothetical protein